MDLDIEKLKVDPDGHDSDGSLFVQISSDKNMFPPITYSVIDEYLKK